ncbi:MAG: putative LPLAT superfamily acyltransferase [Cellvibrionaceae bacterium]|jgi:predicted LPLAT superfamily acyltransferase
MDKSSALVNKQHWASLQEAGTLTGLRFLFLLYRLFGKGFYSLLMYPVAFYFLLFNAESRRASQFFLKLHWQVNPGFWVKKPSFFNSVIHFKQFAETILDKALAWSSEITEDEFVVEDFSIIEELMADKRGQLVIGTHFGNLEYCRGFMQRYKEKIINILVYDKHSANFVQVMQKLNSDSRVNIFQVDEFDVATILLLKQKIDKGEWVFIAGDRIPLGGLQRTIEVDFLGKKAPLPIGPYLLAKALECPVKLMFGYRHPKLGKDKVCFEVVPFAEAIHFSRKSRQQALHVYAQEFASNLERHSLQAPYQWFNFYDFWGDSQRVEIEDGSKQ